MAETIRIEIPIEAKDNTGAGVRSAQRSLMGLERDMQRMQQTMDRLFGKNHSATIDVGLHDNATDALSNIEGRAEQIDHMSVVVDTETNDIASQQIGEVSDSVSALDGETATVEATMHDSAMGPLHDVQDAASAVNGTAAVVGTQVEDGATGPLADIQDAADALNGMSVTIDANVNDRASPVLADLASQAGGALSSGVGSAAGAAKSGSNFVLGKLGGAAALAGLTLGVGDAINTYKDFEYTMARVGAISGATDQEFADLTASAKELGRTTMFTATQVGQAYTYMGMAGWGVDQMKAGIGGILNLAAASGEDLGLVSDIVTDAMTAMGIAVDGYTENGISNVDHFADVLAQTAMSSNTDVGKMGESFKYAAPLAGTYGYSIEDLGIAIGLMASGSIKASQAGTTLRRAILNLAKPTEEGAAIMEKYGLSFFDGEGKARPFLDIMGDLRETFAGMSDEEITSAIGGLFDTTALSGMLNIINASEEDYQKLIDALYNADGAAQEMSDRMMDSLQGSMFYLSSAFEGVQDIFGERITPYLRSAMDSITEMLPQVGDAINQTFDDLESAFDIDGIEGVATEVGNIIGDMAASIGDAVPQAIESASGFVSKLMESIGSEENSADIGGAAAKIITSLGENFLELTGEAGVAAGNLMLGLVNGLNEEGAGERIGEAGKNLVTNLGNWFSTHGSEFGEAAGNLITSLATNLSENSGEIISAGIDIMGGIGQGLIKGGAVLIGEMPNIIGNVIEGAVNSLPKVLEAGKAIGLTLADGIKSAASAINEAMHFINHYGEVSEETQEYVQNNASSVQAAMQSLLDSGWAEDQGIDMSLAGNEGTVANFISQWAKAGMTVDDVAKAVDDAMIPGADPMQLGIMQHAEMEYGALTSAAAELAQAEQDAAAAEAELGDNADQTASAMDSAADSATGYSETTQAAIDAATEGLDGNMAESAESMAAGIEAAKEEVNGFAEEVTGMGDALSGAMEGLDEGVINKILGSEDMSAAAEEITSAMTTATEGISQAFGNMGPAISESMSSISESTTSATEALTAMQEAATSAAEGISSAMQGISEGFAQLGQLGSVDGGAGADQMLSGITDMISQVNEAITTAFAEPTQVEATVDATVTLGEADPSPAKTDFDSRAQETFNTPAQVNATVDVVNVSLGSVSGLEAAYAAFAAQAQAAFSTPVNVTGTVNVSTSANVGGAGAAQSAEGRFVDGPLLSWVGEDGPEYIIPVGDKRTSRGMDLWMQAGEALGAFDEGGIPGFADGGYVGGPSPSPDYSGYLSSGSGGGGGASPEVVISMAPNFTVNGSGDSRETAEEIRRMMLGMTDDIAAEMGRRLKEAYANMPR